MEAIDREDLDPKTIFSKPELNNEVITLTKDEIIGLMQTVITGCYNSNLVSNTFSSWKNTAKGLATIKHIENDFYMGVNLWLNITMDSIIGCSDNELLKSMSTIFLWIKDLLLIKTYINKYHNNNIYV